MILQKCPDEVKHQIPAEPEVCTELIRRARPRFDCVMLALTRMWLQKTTENSAIYSFGIAASPGPPFIFSGLGGPVHVCQVHRESVPRLEFNG